MKTSAFSLALGALLAAAISLRAQEPTIPEGPPPDELVGRWLEKTATRKGDLTGYNLYVFSRKSEFSIITLALNEKTKKWVNPAKLYPKNRPALSGYFEVKKPDQLTFDVVALGLAVLPLEMKYQVEGKTLALSKNIFDLDRGRGVKCARVDRLPGETAAEAAAFQKRIEQGLNGPDFREIFTSAAHEMKPHPTDQMMIDNFDDHREDFETLRGMMQADQGLERVAPDFVRPENPAGVGINPERVELYRALCRKIGLERGIESFGASAAQLEFLASCRGLSISGSCKSYVWLREPPEPTTGRAVVNDLDAYLRTRREERGAYFKAHHHAISGHVDAYRLIDGPWYLHYQD